VTGTCIIIPMNNASSIRVMPAVDPEKRLADAFRGHPDKSPRPLRPEGARTAHPRVFLPVILLVGTLLLGGCVGTEPPVAADAVIGDFDNACLPEAMIMAQALKRNGIRARVLIINCPRWSHAVTAFQYPSGKGEVWCWDSDEKSMPVTSTWCDSKTMAQAWMLAAGHHEPVLDARFK